MIQNAPKLHTRSKHCTPSPIFNNKTPNSFIIPRPLVRNRGFHKFQFQILRARGKISLPSCQAHVPDCIAIFSTNLSHSLFSLVPEHPLKWRSHNPGTGLSKRTAKMGRCIHLTSTETEPFYGLIPLALFQFLLSLGLAPQPPMSHP